MGIFLGVYIFGALHYDGWIIYISNWEDERFFLRLIPLLFLFLPPWWLTQIFSILYEFAIVPQFLGLGSIHCCWYNNTLSFAVFPKALESSPINFCQLALTIHLVVFELPLVLGSILQLQDAPSWFLVVLPGACIGLLPFFVEVLSMSMELVAIKFPFIETSISKNQLSLTLLTPLAPISWVVLIRRPLMPTKTILLVVLPLPLVSWAIVVLEYPVAIGLVPFPLTWVRLSVAENNISFSAKLVLPPETFITTFGIYQLALAVLGAGHPLSYVGRLIREIDLCVEKSRGFECQSWLYKILWDEVCCLLLWIGYPVGVETCWIFEGWLRSCFYICFSEIISKRRSTSSFPILIILFDWYFLSSWFLHTFLHDKISSLGINVVLFYFLHIFGGRSGLPSPFIFPIFEDRLIMRFLSLKFGFNRWCLWVCLEEGSRRFMQGNLSWIKCIWSWI